LNLVGLILQLPAVRLTDGMMLNTVVVVDVDVVIINIVIQLNCGLTRVAIELNYWPSTGA